MTAPYRIEALDEAHGRGEFQCGVEPLDRYFQTQVTQDIRRRITNCFVAVEITGHQLAGYYTLASAGIATSDLPESITKRLPRYPTLPAVRIGRLAVDLRFRGKGLGGAMLADAVIRTLQAPPAAYTMVVDAKDEPAVAFYEHHGFTRLSSHPFTLFLPLAMAQKIFLK